MVELYDLNKDNNNCVVWSFHKFFKLDPDDYFFTFDYELFEIKDRNEYVIVFIPQNPQIYIDNYILDVTFMKKFRFQSFDINAFEERGSITYQDYLYTKILNVFFMDDSSTLAILYISETDYFKLNLKFYNTNLKPLSYIKDVELNNQLIEDYEGEDYEGEDLFIKSLYLNIFDEQFVLFIYFDIYFSYFVFDLFYINIKDFKNIDNQINPILEERTEIINIDFNGEESPNDFIKIKDSQVAFMYIGKQDFDKLGIILIDINIYIGDFYIRKFYINLENYSPTQIKGFAYNNYLLFSATGNIVNDYYRRLNFDEYLSMFMIFGYANGTDCNIDISKFLFKDEYNKENNFFWFLFQNLTMEN